MKNTIHLMLFFLLWASCGSKRESVSPYAPIKQAFNNFFVYELYTRDLNVKHNNSIYHNVEKKIALNWLLKLNEKGYDTWAENRFFWDNNYKLCGAKGDVFPVDSFHFKTNIDKRLKSYQFDFGNSYHTDTSYAHTIVMSFASTPFVTNRDIMIEYSKPLMLRLAEKSDYFIIIADDDMYRPCFYYLSNSFYSYDFSIKALWLRSYKKIRDYLPKYEYNKDSKEKNQYSKWYKSQYKPELIALLKTDKIEYYVDYFRLILESDYRPVDFKLLKQKETTLTFSFFSRTDQKTYTLRFDALQPYNFTLK